MKIISESLKGIVTFRGFGFVMVDGILVPICGQEMIDFGNGAEASYVDVQIKKLFSAKPTIRGIFRGVLQSWGDGDGYVICKYGTVTADLPKSSAFAGGYAMVDGILEGIPLGIVLGRDFDPGASVYTPRMCAPFEVRYFSRFQTSTTGVEQWGDQSKFALGNTHAYDYNAAMPIEVFIPGA